MAFIALCLSAGATAQDLPTISILKLGTKAVPPPDVDAAQLLQIERRANARDKLFRNVTEGLLIMFLFGSFCAIWAQNASRNPWFWFLCGFVFTVFAVLFILWLNPKIRRRKKRYRRPPDYWTLAHF